MRSSRPSRLLSWLPLLLIGGCTLLYAAFLGGMAVADPVSIARFEEQIRGTALFDSSVRKSFRTHIGTEWYTIRHVVGFFPLGLLLGLLGWTARLREQRRHGWRTSGRLLGGTASLIVVLEIAQFWIPGRNPDVLDVVAGFGGTAGGFLLAAGIPMLLAFSWSKMIALLAWSGLRPATESGGSGTSGLSPS